MDLSTRGRMGSSRTAVAAMVGDVGQAATVIGLSLGSASRASSAQVDQGGRGRRRPRRLGSVAHGQDEVPQKRGAAAVDPGLIECKGVLSAGRGTNSMAISEVWCRARRGEPRWRAWADSPERCAWWPALVAA